MIASAIRITIDNEFKRLLVPQSEAESKFLEESLIEEGCRDSLVIWDSEGEFLLVDGHHRYEICERLGIPYETIEREFKDREAVKDWIDRNQLGKRNLSPEDFRIVSGRIYNRRKRAVGEHKGNQHSKMELDQFDPIPDTTADQIANELGVSSPTIKRNAVRAEVYDAFLDIGDEEAAKIIKKATQSEVAEVAKKVVPKNIKSTSKKHADREKDDAEERRKAREAAAAELKAAKAVHVSQNTGMPEWYTPVKFLDAARAVMGGIDTDPATSEIAQKNVKAKNYFTVDDNGLEKDWSGRVWMNPPYTSGLVDKFIDKLCKHYSDGDVTEAIVLVNNATETKWFQQAAQASSAVCFPSSRIKFLDPEGKQGAPLQGQAIIYLGGNQEEFREEFHIFGFVAFTEALG